VSKCVAMRIRKMRMSERKESLEGRRFSGPNISCDSETEFFKGNKTYARKSSVGIPLNKDLMMSKTLKIVNDLKCLPKRL
jgi:hypothetical protein